MDKNLRSKKALKIVFDQRACALAACSWPLRTSTVETGKPWTNCAGGSYSGRIRLQTRTRDVLVPTSRVAREVDDHGS